MSVRQAKKNGVEIPPGGVFLPPFPSSCGWTVSDFGSSGSVLIFLKQPVSYKSGRNFTTV